VLTYLLAVLASCANATASVLQRKANRDVPGADSLSLRLIEALLRRPVWFAGVLAVTAGFALQAAALAVGELSVVEPILVFELPLTLVLASVVFRARLHTREWACALGMTTGLAAVLYFLAPSESGVHAVDWYVWPAGVGANLAVVAAALQWGRRSPAPSPGPAGSGRRAAAYGVAAGCQFGLTAALMKGAMSRYEDGIDDVFTSWQLYAMVLAGVLAMFLLQSALHAGKLLAAQPGLTLSDPLISVLWGVLAFHEHVRTGQYLLGALVGAAVIMVSVHLLSRSPLLDRDEVAAGTDREGPQAPDTTGRRAARRR
jgi:drug/metabolite transporter (DMT)-like permease